MRINNKIYIFRVLLIISIILSSCGGSPDVAIRDAQELSNDCELSEGAEITTGYDPQPPPEWSEDYPQYGLWNRERVIFFYSIGTSSNLESSTTQAISNAMPTAVSTISSLVVEQINQVFQDLESSASDAAVGIIDFLNNANEIIGVIPRDSILSCGSYTIYKTTVKEFDPQTCEIIDGDDILSYVYRGAISYETYINYRARIVENLYEMLSEEQIELMDNTRAQLVLLDEQLFE